MSKLICVYVCLMLSIMFFAVSCAEQTTYAPANGGTARYTTEGYTQDVNLERLADRARTENKQVYMYFTAPWCPNCRDFERDTLSTSEAQRALGKVIYIRANFDAHRNLAEKFNITGIPTGVLLAEQDGQLKMVNKHVGGLSPEGLATFLGQ